MECMDHIQEQHSRYLFSQETINSLTEFGKILKIIYTRMKSEGYDIVNGKIINLETGKEYEATKQGKT
jgi:hypothetical protein